MNDMSRRIVPPLPPLAEEPERTRHYRSGPFGVLDIGTTKIACLIGRTESDGTLRVLGFGWHRGRGVRGGSISIAQGMIALDVLLKQAPLGQRGDQLQFDRLILG